MRAQGSAETTARTRPPRSAASWALGHYALMLGASTLITSSPRRRRLPLAMACSLAGLGLDRLLGASSSAPWFAPVYYGKVLVGHAAGSIWNLRSGG